jgi:hypothetical protein
MYVYILIKKNFIQKKYSRKNRKFLYNGIFYYTKNIKVKKSTVEKMNLSKKVQYYFLVLKDFSLI